MQSLERAFALPEVAVRPDSVVLLPLPGNDDLSFFQGKHLPLHHLFPELSAVTYNRSVILPGPASCPLPNGFTTGP